jgi:type I restriction enzyme, S subunit
MLVDFNVEKSNKALDELHKENKKYVPVKEDEYLTEVPSRWQWSRLGYVTNNHGQKEPQEDFCYIDVGTLDNINHCLAKKENLVNKEEAPSRARKIVEQGDVLYSTVRPYLHNICIINKDFSRMPVASTAFCVMAVEEKVLINKYLFYWLLSPEFDKFSNGNPSKGTLYPAIGEKDLLNGVIPIPDIEEQKLIVEKLDSAFEHLDKLNRLQTQYSSDLEVLKSKIIDAGIQGKLTEQLPEDGTAEELLEQIAKEKKQLIKEKKTKATKALPEITEDEIPFEIPVNWKWVRLADICSKITSGNTPAGGSKGGAYVTEGNCFFREQNIYNDGIHYEGMVYITDELLATRENSTVLPQDILLNITGGSIGRCALIPDDFSKGSINQHILIIRVIEPEIRQYIHKCLCSPYYQKLIMGNVVGDKDGFSAGRCKNTLIPLPPIGEQKRIVEKITQILEQI